MPSGGAFAEGGPGRPAGQAAFHADVEGDQVVRQESATVKGSVAHGHRHPVGNAMSPATWRTEPSAATRKRYSDAARPKVLHAGTVVRGAVLPPAPTPEHIKVICVPGGTAAHAWSSRGGRC
jgi:hypothetical protein